MTVDAQAILLPPLAGAVGFGLWSLVEYTVHGFLSHRLRTPVSPLHWGHHREPRAVFTSPLAWLPVALLIFAASWAVAGLAVGGALSAGLLLGFARYEVVHWRIHFRAPRSDRERRLRAHHLAHHFVRPSQYHGVTTRIWDRVFGSLPERWPEDYARGEARPPIEGPSNLRLLYGRGGLAAVRRAREQLAERDSTRA